MTYNSACARASVFSQLDHCKEMLVAQKDVPYISIPTDLTKLTTLLLLEISILLIVLLFVASK